MNRPLHLLTTRRSCHMWQFSDLEFRSQSSSLSSRQLPSFDKFCHDDYLHQLCSQDADGRSRHHLKSLNHLHHAEQHESFHKHLYCYQCSDSFNLHQNSPYHQSCHRRSSNEYQRSPLIPASTTVCIPFVGQKACAVLPPARSPSSIYTSTSTTTLQSTSSSLITTSTPSKPSIFSSGTTFTTITTPSKESPSTAIALPTSETDQGTSGDSKPFSI